MTIPPVESFARIDCFSSIYAEIAEKGYLEYLEATSSLSRTHDDDYERISDLKHEQQAAGLQAIVFFAMTLEAAIYDFASIHLGDKYVKEHLDRLGPCSKWIVILRLIAGVELPENKEPYLSLKALVSIRNKLIHSKSKAISFSELCSNPGKAKKGGIELGKGVACSLRALVLMSLYLESNLDSYVNPLPSYSGVNATVRRYYPQLKEVIRALVVEGFNE